MPKGEEIIEEATRILEFSEKEEFYKKHLQGKILVDPHNYVVLAKNGRFKVGLFLFYALKAYQWLKDHNGLAKHTEP